MFIALLNSNVYMWQEISTGGKICTPEPATEFNFCHPVLCCSGIGLGGSVDVGSHFSGALLRYMSPSQVSALANSVSRLQDDSHGVAG